MNMNNKKVILTGGTGFIGKYVLDSLLEEGAKVYSFSRNDQVKKHPLLIPLKCDLRNIDLEEYKGIAKDIGSVDFIIYMAASIPTSGQKRESIVDSKINNLDSLVNFINAFGMLAKKIIYLSSIDIYGRPLKTYFDENTNIEPLTNYAIAKYCSEKYVEYFCKTNSITSIILRLSQVYGPLEPKVRVMSFIIDAILNDKEFILRGTGKDKRRFIYVKDVVLAIYKAIEYSSSDVFNISGKEDISIIDAIKTVEKSARKKIKLAKEKSDDPIVHILPSSAKAERLLNFHAQYTFANGIDEIISKYKVRIS